MNEVYSQNKRRRVGLGSDPDQENNEDDLFGTQFSVPASQAPSQRRYLSQRSNLQRSQVVRTGRRPPANYYESVLAMAGLSLGEPGGAVVLKHEPIVFMHKLKSVLRTNADYPANIDRFIAGIQAITEEKNKQAITAGNWTNFSKLLECCYVQPSATDPAKRVQESLMKMFLLVDFLQLKLIELLFAYLGKELDRTRTPADEATEVIVRMVLSQLKFIDHVSNGDMVFARVFELLAKANETFEEIILHMEDVIDVSKHDEALERLAKLRPKPEELITPITVDVFTKMCLSVETLQMLRGKVVQYAADGCLLRFYPSLVQMMLKFNRTAEPMENIHGIVREVRKLLDTDTWTTGGGSTAADYAEQMLRCVYQQMSASAVFFDAWVAIVRQLPTAEDHLPVDLLLLTMATTINEVKAPRIRKLTIKKIAQQFFTDAHTDQLVSGYFRRVLQSHLDSFLQLIECCTREKAEQVCGFGVAALSALFTLDQSIVTTDNRVLLNKIVGFICEMASANMMSRNDFLIGRCIVALRKLHESHPKEIERSAELLLKILDVAPELTLRQYRPLIGVIYAAAIPRKPTVAVCGGGGGDTDSSAIRDSLEIIVKKQLLCGDKDTKQKGIVGLVHMVYALSQTAEAEAGVAVLSSNFDSERTFDTIGEIPSEIGQTLANLLSTLFLSTNQSPDLLAICYDELATMIGQSRPRSVPDWEKTFIMWLCDTVTMDFQSHFLVEAAPELRSAPITLARQLCINSAAVGNYQIAVNVGGVVLTQQSRTSVITFLAPIFRLMRTLHAVRYEGSLETINALLGCAMIVPDFYGNTAEEERRFSVDEYDETFCTQLLDVYFYVANWFRECINAFVNQPDDMMRRKVLERLHELVKLEHHLGRMLDRISAESKYLPPLATTERVEGSSAMGPKKLAKVTEPAVRAGRGKKASSRAQLDRTINLDGTLGSTEAAQEAAVGQFNEHSLLVRYPSAFRCIDPLVVRLFGVPLRPVRVLDDPEQRATCLALAEYRFVLENVTLALEQPEPETFQRGTIERWSDIVDRTALLADELRTATERLQPVPAAELLPLKACYLWSVRLTTALLSWKRFREQRGRADLERVLRVLVEKLTPAEGQPIATTEGCPLPELATKLLQEVITRESCFGDMSIAAQMYQLGRTIGEDGCCAVERNVASKAIARFARTILTAPDLNTVDGGGGGKSKAAHFVTLLDGMIGGSIGMRSLKQLIVAMGQDLGAIEERRDKSNTSDGRGAVRTFPAFGRPQYSLLFKGLCRAFVRVLQEEIRTRGAARGAGGPGRRLELWEMACETAGELTGIVKRPKQSAHFGVYLRFAQIFIKLFLKSGLPVLESILRSSPQRASELLTKLQITTRYLHSVCCQAKVSGKGSTASVDAAAVAQIPNVRECVEQLVYHVKALLVANRCSAAFWMGNLKNKDTLGDLIVSQSTLDGSDDDDGDDDGDQQQQQQDHDQESDIADEMSDHEVNAEATATRRNVSRQLDRQSLSRSSSASLAKSSQSKCF
ncbi:Fanconi anemia group D2 protein homolog [Anopheles cruzii]|uniref:Fanconi anemia group D2 protein homolog n=1 Tax=Anopheles cruzii TaxID=68878 RepID=UPI0022EC4268|nr:Fanconi anemia group D2 protein homolog [Anopheles cruzii]